MQEAEIDPALYLDDELDDDAESDADWTPCPVCGENDNEDHLLNCDGCEVEYHTYCVDLDSTPRTQWFCENCAVQRALDDVNYTPRQHRASDRRTRSQRRQARRHNQTMSSSWARVWQSVWNNLNLDLDFPYDESEQTPAPRATRGQRREFAQWRRRFEIAQRQGGGSSFRDTAATLLDIRNAQDQQSIAEPESQEELRAWNALEKAKEIDRDPSASSARKRKSAPTSPAESTPTPQTDRPLKRPRTRRVVETSESARARSSAVSTARIAPGESPPAQQASIVESSSNGPSFLQSLLKEVETSAAADEAKGQQPLRIDITNRPSPQPSSPDASPTASNHATPRAVSTTPPPFASPRSGSPMLLTSRVEPIYPLLNVSPHPSSPIATASNFDHDQDFSPTQSPIKGPAKGSLDTNDHHDHPKLPDARVSRLPLQASPKNSPPRSLNTSPAREKMSLNAKSSLQKIVSAALRPHYHSNKIDKDQYTDINRNVSRMLYDMVGKDENVDGEKREEWERIAKQEVERAIEALKAT